MTPILTALAPIMALIVIGFGLKRASLLAEGGWASLERLTYFVLFPALLISTLSSRDLAGTEWIPTLGVLVFVIAGACIALLLWQLRVRPLAGPTFTSVFQGGVRFNTYISLALIQAFLGADGLLAGAVAFTFLVVLVNVASITAFAVWGAGARRGLLRLIREIFLNPLIIACVLGGYAGASGTELPEVVADTLAILGAAALPLGLLAVGAALRPEEVPGHLEPALVASAVQFGLKPLLAGLATLVLDLPAATAGALLIIFMTPTASASYILARQLGGDTAAMASIVTLQTALAFAVIPALTWLWFSG